MALLTVITALYGYLVPPVMVLLSATLAIRAAYQDIRTAFRDRKANNSLSVAA